MSDQARHGPAFQAMDKNFEIFRLHYSKLLIRLRLFKQDSICNMRCFSYRNTTGSNPLPLIRKRRSSTFVLSERHTSLKMKMTNNLICHAAPSLDEVQCREKRAFHRLSTNKADFCSLLSIQLVNINKFSPIALTTRRQSDVGHFICQLIPSVFH